MVDKEGDCMKKWFACIALFIVISSLPIATSADTNDYKAAVLEPPTTVCMTFDYKAAINSRLAEGYTSDDALIKRWKELRIQKIKMLTPEQAKKYNILDEYEILKSGIPANSEQAALDILEQSKTK
jgi:hypothetical protein